MKKYHFRGRVSTGSGVFPVEDTLEARSNTEALKKVQAEADRMFLIDRNSVYLDIFDESDRTIGTAIAPSKTLVRLCEFCPDATKRPAQYHISWHDSWADVCEKCVGTEEERRQDYEKGILLGIHDIQKGVPVDPITLEPLKK